MVDLLDLQSHIKCNGKVVWSIKRKTTEKDKPSFFDTGVEFVDLKKEDEDRINHIIQHLLKL